MLNGLSISILFPDDASDKGLHPSWQAKKREKELHINIDQPQGKKIKFDD